MHETGLVRAAVETAAAAAERAGGPVRSVRLGLGITGATIQVDRLRPTDVCAGCGRPVRNAGCDACDTAETRFAVPAGLSVLEITLDD